MGESALASDLAGPDLADHMAAQVAGQLCDQPSLGQEIGRLHLTSQRDEDLVQVQRPALAVLKQFD